MMYSNISTFITLTDIRLFILMAVIIFLAARVYSQGKKSKELKKKLDFAHERLDRHTWLIKGIIYEMNGIKTKDGDEKES